MQANDMQASPRSDIFGSSLTEQHHASKRRISTQLASALMGNECQTTDNCLATTWLHQESTGEQF